MKARAWLPVVGAGVVVSVLTGCAGHRCRERGWIGDSPFIFLDCARMRRLGWAPKLSIQQGILRTLEYLRANPWVLEARQ